MANSIYLLFVHAVRKLQITRAACKLHELKIFFVALHRDQFSQTVLHRTTKVKTTIEEMETNKAQTI
jgi:hypothetical protein